MERSNRGIGTGILLLTIGIIWVLANFGIITWSIFNSLFVLWPLILVVVGIDIIFKRNWIVRAVAWFAFLAILVTYGMYSGKNDNIDKNFTATGKSVTVEKQTGVEKGILNLSLGGSSIKVDSGTASLLEAALRDKDNIEYHKSISSDNSTVSMEFKRNKDINIHLGDGVRNDFLLNENVNWDIEVNTGASETDMDLTKLKVDRLAYNGGASSFKLALGDKNSVTNVTIASGVSDIEVRVPENAGVRVKSQSGLVSSSFSGGGWQTVEGYTKTENYDQASSKIEIDIQMGVSNFVIERVKQ